MKPEIEEVRCRIKRVHWWLVPLLFLFGVLALYVPSQTPRQQSAASLYIACIIFGLMATTIFFGLFYAVRSLLFDEIVANEAGVRWRGALGPWKSARWEEITDFYLTKVPRNPLVETPVGKLKFGPDFANKNQMMEFIAKRALNAPSRQWEFQEFRASENFSQRFDYWTKTQKWTAPIMLGILGLAIILQLHESFFSPKSRMLAVPADTTQPVAWITLLLGTVLFGPLVVACVVGFIMMWCERNFAFQRRDEHLEISPHGLAWQRGETRIEASWDEVRAITPLPGNSLKPNYRVETQNGDFMVWKSLHGLLSWLQLVRHFAPQIAPEIVTNIDLGSDAATWSGGKVGEGDRIFHFRTLNTRLALWFPTLVLPCSPLPLFLRPVFQMPDAGPVAPLSFVDWSALFIALLAVFYLWVLFSRAAIWADETGLQWRLPLFKTRRVAWHEIESFGRDDSGVFLVIRGQKRRLWRFFAPARRKELLQLLENRVPNAAGRFNP